MKMLSRVTRMDRIIDKAREDRLRWFGQRMLGMEEKRTTDGVKESLSQLLRDFSQKSF